MGHVNVSYEPCSNDHFQEGPRHENENKISEQQETHPNNQLLKWLGGSFHSDTLANKMSDNNRADMKGPPNIFIASNTLPCSQSGV